MQNSHYIMGIDTGGTFTDVVLMTKGGDVYTTKAPTTPHDFAQGVMDGIHEMAKLRGLSVRELLSSVDMIKHGTTVVTNALINRSGCKVGLITTKGFERIPIIMRGGMGRTAGLVEDELKNNIMATKPEPLVPPSLIKGVSERIDCFGNIIVPLNVEEARESFRYLVEDKGVEALVVSLLFSFVNNSHEKAMKDLFNDMYPSSDIYLSLVHELVPVIREYARTNTAIINAYVSKVAFRYSTSLQAKLKGAGFKGHLLYVQGNGGTTLIEELNPIGMEHSGPAGGVVATKFMADLLGHEQVISSDSGGTSFDVSVVKDGLWRYSRDPVIERYHCILPLIDIQAIGSGGGTMAQVDPDTKTLTVGPKSAGAYPGPVCYDQGGTQPTIVDANLMLGLMDPDFFLGGRVKLNKAKAEKAIKEKLADPLDMDILDVAAGIYDIANAHMSDLIRKQIMPLGLEPSKYVIYAHGGTGPVHAAAYALELGVPKVYVFPISSTFSAMGAAIADVIVSEMVSYQFFMPADPKVLNEKLKEMHTKLYAAMERQGAERDKVEFRHIFYMRYRKQLNELPVNIPVKTKYNEKDVLEIMDTFDQEYEETYGVGAAYKQAGMEMISMQIDAIAKGERIKIKKELEGDPNPSKAIKGERKACFAGKSREFVPTPIYDYYRLTAGNIINGPGIIESPLNTVVIPPGAKGEMDKYLNIEVTVQTDDE